MDLYQMSQTHKDALRKNRVFLLEHIHPSEGLLGYLLQENILTCDMYEEIDAEIIRKKKVAKLLDILPRRGPKAFSIFITALMNENQEFVAHKLDHTLEKKWNDDNNTKTPPSPQLATHQGQTMPKAPSLTPVYDDSEKSGFFNPKVKMINQNDKSVLKLVKDRENNYRMSSKPRGRAIIINNTYFVNQPSREGAMFDSQNICNHLDQLYFNTQLHTDLTAEEMQNLFLEESQRSDHSSADCFLAFIMSHGSKGFIYGVDGKRVSIENDIVAPFHSNRCPYLKDKPKMFFIQTCQGEAATECVFAGGESEVDAVPVAEHLVQALKDLKFQDNDQTMPHLKRTHEQADIVLAYSTVPGYRSWRRTDLGSWFVRAIIKVFANHAHEEDLLSLLVKVREEVSNSAIQHKDHSFLQLTKTEETTRKKIFFFPGYHENNRGIHV